MAPSANTHRSGEMHWIPKSRRLPLLAVFVLVLLFSFSRWGGQISQTPPDTSTTYPLSSKAIPTTPRDWKFTASRDRNNHSLTSEQCLDAFPDLYREIDRSRAYWKERLGDQKLTKEQWELKWSGDGGLHVLIWDGQIYILESRGLNHFQHWKERSHATLHNLHRAIQASREPIPNIEFSMKINDEIGLTSDHPNITVWNFNRNVNDEAMKQVWLIPDFNFWAYPRVAGAFGDYQRQAIEIGSDYDAKVPELVWRGTLKFNPEIRVRLLEQTHGKPWSAVHSVSEDKSEDQSDAAAYRITMPDHCRYKFAVHTEGTTWSGRLKYLLSCHSTVIIHPLTYTTHLYHLLEPDGPNQNYVRASKDWTELPATMDALLADNVRARRIADNAAAKFRDQYFTPAAQTCYFRQLFQVWSEMTATPQPPYVYTVHADGTETRDARGMTYEEYLFLEGTQGFNNER